MSTPGNDRDLQCSVLLATTKGRPWAKKPPQVRAEAAQALVDCSSTADYRPYGDDLHDADAYAAFDASATGGYRDLLLNLRCLATGHIVELQITLKGLIDVKAGGGHANYAIARVHRLFERDTYRYEGALGDAVLELFWRGRSIWPPAKLADQQRRVVAAVV